MEGNQTGSIYQKMCAILREVEGISKRNKNAAQGFAYRSIDDMYNTLHDLFAKHEVFILTNVLEVTANVIQSNGKNIYQTCMHVEFSFIASDGSRVSAKTYADALDTADKGSGKCLSYALKNVLTQTFLIPVEGNKDNDADHIETAANGTVSPAFKPKISEELKNTALKEIQNAKDRQELKNLYYKYKPYYDELNLAFQAKKQSLAE